MSLAILDIKSAFLYGKARRKFAPEDPRRGRVEPVLVS